MMINLSVELVHPPVRLRLLLLSSRRRYHHEQRRCCIPELSIHANNQVQEQEGQSATFSNLEMPRAVQKSSMDRGDPRLSLSASDESSTLPLVSLELSEIDKDS